VVQEILYCIASDYLNNPASYIKHATVSFALDFMCFDSRKPFFFFFSKTVNVALQTHSHYNLHLFSTTLFSMFKLRNRVCQLGSSPLGYST